jgi:hypothetical protein
MVEQQTEHTPFDEFKQQAEKELSEIDSNYYDILHRVREHRKEAWADWDKRVEESGLAEDIRRLMTTSNTYERSVKRRALSGKLLIAWDGISAVGLAMLRQYGIQLTNDYSEFLGVAALYIGINAFFAYDIITSHIKAKEAKNEITDYVGPEDFDEAVGWLRNKYNNVNRRFRFFKF